LQLYLNLMLTGQSLPAPMAYGKKIHAARP
jgi:hypothetical protein